MAARIVIFGFLCCCITPGFCFLPSVSNILKKTCPSQVFGGSCFLKPCPTGYSCKWLKCCKNEAATCPPGRTKTGTCSKGTCKLFFLDSCINGLCCRKSLVKLTPPPPPPTTTTSAPSCPNNTKNSGSCVNSKCISLLDTCTNGLCCRKSISLLPPIDRTPGCPFGTVKTVNCSSDGTCSNGDMCVNGFCCQVSGVPPIEFPRSTCPLGKIQNGSCSNEGTCSNGATCVNGYCCQVDLWLPPGFPTSVCPPREMDITKCPYLYRPDECGPQKPCPSESECCGNSCGREKRCIHTKTKVKVPNI